MSRAAQDQAFRTLVKAWVDTIPLAWLEEETVSMICQPVVLSEIRVLAAQGYRRAQFFVAHYRPL
ncbi:MAG: hypothetical protein AB7E44_02470 [Acidithiobacillus sp.]